MGYQIDQSGKIEQTNWPTPTVVALTNGRREALRISAAEKQKLLRAVSDLEKPKTNYIYRLFAALVFLLIKDRKLVSVLIDIEYVGHESVIKDTLIYLFVKHRLKIPEISFGLIGKRSKAHRKALGTFQRIEKPEKIVKAEEIFRALYSNKKGRRSPSGSDNP